MVSGGGDLGAAEVGVLAEAFAQAAREMRRSVPVPKGAPYYGLDIGLSDLTALDLLCREGIFRKYQSAAVLECGLGGTARWWSARFGCRVVGFDARHRLLAAGRRLQEGAPVAPRAELACSRPAPLAASAETFTHVWCVDPGSAAEDIAAEALRVLRPSGFFGLHGSECWAGEVERWEAALGAAGFVALERRRVPLVEPPSYVAAARTVLRHVLEGRPEAARLAALCGEPQALRATAVQLIAQRPS